MRGEIYGEKTLLGMTKSMDSGLKDYKLKDFYVPHEYRRRHLLYFGTTGSGKTSLAENLMEQDILAGRTVVFIDPKGAQDTAAKIIQIAGMCGRENDLMFLSAVFPEYSIKINPCSHWSLMEELIAHCVSGIKEGRDPFFRNKAMQVAGTIIMSLNEIARSGGEERAEFTLQMIKHYVSREGLMDLREQLSVIVSREAEDIVDDLDRISASGQDHFSKVVDNLSIALGELTTGNIGKIVGNVHENKFIERLEQNRPVILVCQLGNMIVNDAAKTLGKLILSMIQSCVGRAFLSNQKKANPPICLHIDEAQSVCPPTAIDLWSKGGSADLWITAYAQSVNDFYESLGKDLTGSLLANSNTKGFLRVTDPETADYVTRHFGTRKVLSPVISPGHITSREVEEDVVRNQDIMNLRNREFYMLTYPEENTLTGRYRGRTSDTSPRWLTIKYPDILSTRQGKLTADNASGPNATAKNTLQP